MHRSPLNLRSGNQVKPVPLSVSDKRPDRNSSTTPATDNKSDMAINTKTVEDAVNKYMSGDVVFDRLITRITDHLKIAVESAVKAALVAVNAELATLKKEVSELKEDLALRCDELEQYQRRNNLRIFGLKEKDGESTDALIVELCRDKLGMELPEDAVCRSHRVGKKKGPTPDGRQQHRPIIVRFVSYRDRRNVYSCKKKLKGTGVTIREDLTALRVKTWKTAVERHGLRNTWTQDGRILWMGKDGRRGVATSLRDLGTAAT